MKFVLATHNPGKLREMGEILSSLGVEVVSPADVGITVDVEETGTTFLENALIKAEAAVEQTGMSAIADDSGLVVDALDGEPGVYSARYAGVHGDDAANNAKLLKAFREQGMEVCFAKIQCQKKDGSDRSLDQKATGYNELLLPPGTPSAEIVPELAPMEDELVVTKTTDSVLTGTPLRLWLRNMGIDTVVCTGVLTDQCVSGTVRSLADESFKVWLIEDACMASTQRIQDNELEILNNIYCHVINTEELLEAIR